jgi:hypothetical protein
MEVLDDIEAAMVKTTELDRIKNTGITLQKAKKGGLQHTSVQSMTERALVSENHVAKKPYTKK